MATTFSFDAARAAIKEQGFFSFPNDELGQRFQENQAWALHTIEGFDFFKANIHKNTRIQGILEAFNRKLILADYTRLGPSRGTIYRFQFGGSDDVIQIHLWENDSRPIYYRNSHNVKLWTRLGTNNIWQVLGAELEKAGCLGIPIDLKHGGIVILDGRLAVDFGDKSPIMAAYTTPMVLEKRPMDWPLLRIPRSLKQEDLARLNIHAALEDDDETEVKS